MNQALGLFLVKEMMSTHSGTNVSRLSNRNEFRQVLRKVVQTLQIELRFPGVSPFTPEELSHWFRQITTEDIKAVWDDASQQRVHVIGAGQK